MVTSCRYNKEKKNNFFFFKQKTAYEIKECDWSSDVCSSDLKEFQENIKEQQKQINELENKIRNMQKQLMTNDIEKIKGLRKERKITFEKIEELEKIHFEIKDKTQLAVENIEIEMTPIEVVKLIGEPRAKTKEAYNYGKVWIKFENGVTSCLIRIEHFNNSYNRSHYQSLCPEAIIK